MAIRSKSNESIRRHQEFADELKATQNREEPGKTEVVEIQE